MVREKIYEVYVLNIRLDDVSKHNPASYSALFQAAATEHAIRFARKEYLRFSSQNDCVIPDWVSIGDRLHSANTAMFFTRLVTFTHIDTDVAWFNLDSQQIASNDDLLTVNIPASLRPHFRETFLVFDAQHHRIVFARRPGFYPDRMVPALQHYLSLAGEAFGRFRITVEQSEKGLEEIFALDHLTMLSITIERPNPDMFGHYDEVVAKAMEQQQAQSMTLGLTADNHARIIPNKTTRRLANVALSNGEVIAKGGNQGEPLKKVSTKKRPFSLRKRMDQKLGHFHSMALMAREAIDAIVSAIRRAGGSDSE